MDESEWQTCDDPDSSLPFLINERCVSDRKLRLFACACCERVVHLADPELIPLLRLAERYADGFATAAELSSEHATARERCGDWDDNDPHYRPNQAANEAFVLSVAIGTEPQEGPHIHFVQQASGMTAVAVEHEKRRYEALHEESRQQSALIRDIFGNPFRPVAFDPTWRTDTAVAIARGMYESQDFSAAPVLADALQDAGCDAADLLSHLRDPRAVHVRGCWALDLVLGKE